MSLPEFKRLSEIPPAESFQVLVYGAAGSGKTWLAGTAGDRSLFISNGAGRSTLQSVLFKQKIGANPIVVDIYSDDIKEKAEAYDQIKMVIEHALDNMHGEFDWIVIDDATAFRRSSMLKAMEMNQNTGKSKALEVSKKYDVIIPTMADYGDEMKFTEGFFAETCSICRAEKKHLVVLAHERLTFSKPAKQGDQPTLIKQVPNFTGADKNPDIIPGLFEDVWHMETVGGGEQMIFRARTIGDSVLTAKTRFPGTINQIELRPNLQEIINRIKESRK